MPFLKKINDLLSFFRRRSYKLLQEKRGFTLIEMIATLAVFTIFMTGVTMLVEPSVNTYVKSTDLSRGENICDNVMRLLTTEFAYATSIELGTQWGSSAEVAGAKEAIYQSAGYGEVKFSNTEEGVITLTLTDGSGKINFGREMYMGKKLRVGLSKEKKDVLHIEAAIYDRQDGLIAKQERYVRLLNATL